MYLLLAFLIALGQAQTSQKIYSVKFAGADIISYAGSQFTPPLSYASSLVFNPATNNSTMWLLADEASPNVRSVGWDPLAPTTHGFWLWSSTYIPNHQAAPFFAFTVVGSNFLGTAYASNDHPNEKGIVTQALYAPALGTFEQAVWSLPGYTFVSIVSTEMDPADHTCTVFLAGWAMDSASGRLGFVVARGSAPVNDVFGNITISESDISDPIMDFNCFDVYTVNRKPSIWFNQDASVIVVAVTGRCSTFARFVLPDKATPFSSAEVKVKDPTDTDYEYVSGATLDRPTGKLWYALKKYNTPGAVIKSFDIAAWVVTAVAVPTPYAEADMILAVGRSTNGLVSMLFSIGSGANAIYRWQITPTGGLDNLAFASIPSHTNHISSAIFIDPFLYFTTYEPTAEVVRIPVTNFCTYFCGNFSYCNKGSCDCEPDYSPVLADNGNQAGCISTIWHEKIIVEEESNGLVSVSAVLCAFAMCVNAAGWYSWYRRKQERQNYSPLVTGKDTLVLPGEEL